MGRSQHREVRRRCPGCGLNKLYPERNASCSPACAKLMRQSSRPLPPDYVKTTAAGMSLECVSAEHTLEGLIAHFKVDVAAWECVEFVANHWEMGYVDRNSESATCLPLYQSKARFKPRVLIVNARAEIEALLADAKQKLRRPPNVIRFAAPKTTGNLLEVSIPDLHLAKLAWRRETAHDNYDLEIAERLHDEALEALIDRSSGIKYEKILFCLGNDYLHVDNLEMKTTAGTPVTGDGRYPKMFRLGRQLAVRSIERLKAIAPVHVKIVAGNHDKQSMFCLGDALECWYHADPEVEIDNEPTPWKYFQWGRVLICYMHGHKGKKPDYPLILATERPELWGATSFREIHTGHLHKVGLEEYHGVRVRTLSSLCAEDDWHAENGFVGNIRSAEAYMWNKTQGLVGTAVFNISRHDKIEVGRGE